MNTMVRWLCAGVAALGLAVATATPQAAKRGETPVATGASVQLPAGWRIAEGRTPDPKLVFGTLPNGMRYIIRKGDNPPGQVSIRLGVKVGSMNERDDEQGVAHFLEHMAFRGTASTSDGEMTRRLERLGLRMGADSNASTGPTATTFLLNLAKNDDESISTGIGLLHEIVTELLLDPALMDVERGVVLAEIRERSGAGLDLALKNTKARYGDHPFARSPGGLREIVETAKPETLRAFYDAWYRPERAAIVIAGDVDPKAVEARIASTFASWRARAPARPDPAPLGLPRQRPDIQVLVEQGGGGNTLTFYWDLPYEEPRLDRASLMKNQLQQLGRGVFQNRIRDMLEQPAKPFRFSNGFAPSFVRGVALSSMVDAQSVTDAPATISMLVRAHRQFMQYGFTQAELDRVIKLRRDALARDVDMFATMPTPQVVGAFVSPALDGVLPTNRAEDKAWFEEVAKAATPDSIMAAVRELFPGQPTLIYSGAAEPAGGEAALRAAWTKAKSDPVSAYAAEAVKEWPYTNFGPPGRVASRREVADLGVTYVTFDNGLKLVFKPMPSLNGLTLATLRFGYGKLGLPKDSLGPADFAMVMLRDGGTARLTDTEISKSLAGKGVSVLMSQGFDAYEISNAPGGGSMPGSGTKDSELDLLFQLYAARISDPGWRTDAWQDAIASSEQGERIINNSITAGMALEGDVLLHGGDLRWALSTSAMQKTWKPADTVAFIKPLAATSPLELVVVGDVKVERVIEAVSKSLGALPKRAPKPEPAGLRDVKFPAGRAEPVVYRHKAQADQAQIIVTWPTTGVYANTRDYLVAVTLTDLMRKRISEKMRAEQGKTYSPQVTAQFDRNLPGWGRIGASVAVTPDLVDEAEAAIFAIAEEFKSNDISADQLARTKGPLIEATRRGQTQPGYWMQLLARSDVAPEKLDYVRREIAELDSVTAADIRAAAQRWLDRSKSIRFHMVPEAAPRP